jgi:hypothetical protein
MGFDSVEIALEDPANINPDLYERNWIKMV